MSTAAAAPTGSPAPQRWLTGPWSDLLFGCGLIYLFVFAALAIDGDSVRQLVPLAWMPLIALVTGGPHYGATLLRVYEHRSDRQRYVFFAVFVTIALIGVFVAGLHFVALGSWILTIYLTWSPWHYSAQNYGIAMMFLRRRGVAIEPRAQRVFRWSFVLSFLLTAVMMLAVDSSVSYAPVRFDGTAYQMLSIPLPPLVLKALIPTLIGAYLATLVSTGVLLVRAGATLRDIYPALAIVLSQAMWFVIPAVSRHAGVLQGVDPMGTEHAAYTILWIAMAHSVQYLWITHFYAKKNGAKSSLGWSFKVLAAGSAIWALPALLFAPNALGPLPYDAGLAVMVASIVNLHHFILDGAIWKLRDGPIARVLLRNKSETDEEPAAPRAGWIARSVWVLGTASVVVLFLGTYQTATQAEPAMRRGNVAELAAANEGLRWLGRESAQIHLAMAQIYHKGHMHSEGAASVGRAVALYGSPDTWFRISKMYHGLGRADDAIQAAERAVEARPDSQPFRNGLAALLATYRARDPEAIERAAEIIVPVVAETDGKEPLYLHTMAMIRFAQGKPASALQVAERALELTNAAQQPQLAKLLQKDVSVYSAALRR